MTDEAIPLEGLGHARTVDPGMDTTDVVAFPPFIADARNCHFGATEGA
jgi:hypothetical protein